MAISVPLSTSIMNRELSFQKASRSVYQIPHFNSISDWYLLARRHIQFDWNAYTYRRLPETKAHKWAMAYESCDSAHAKRQRGRIWSDHRNHIARMQLEARPLRFNEAAAFSAILVCHHYLIAQRPGAVVSYASAYLRFNASCRYRDLRELQEWWFERRMLIDFAFAMILFTLPRLRYAHSEYSSITLMPHGAICNPPPIMATHQSIGL